MPWLVSKNFTKPFKEPIQYGKHIAQLSNMLCDGKILVQRFGDFIRGRRTTEERLVRNNITPTLKDAVPGDLSLVFPYRIMKDIEEMIYALDEVTPGMASDETLLYGVEVKFYSNKILVDKNFETNIQGTACNRRWSLSHERTSAGISQWSECSQESAEKVELKKGKDPGQTVSRLPDLFFAAFFLVIGFVGFLSLHRSGAQDLLPDRESFPEDKEFVVYKPWKSVPPVIKRSCSLHRTLICSMVFSSLRG